MSLDRQNQLHWKPVRKASFWATTQTSESDTQGWVQFFYLLRSTSDDSDACLGLRTTGQ